MLKNLKNIAIISAALSLSACASHPREKVEANIMTPDDSYIAPEMPAVSNNGSIYNDVNNNLLIGTGSSYRVGDIIVINMNEDVKAKDSTSNRTTKTSNQKTGLGFKGGFGDTKLPALSVDLNTKNNNNFNGSGDAAQSHSLVGNISVSVVKVFPNGILAIAGRKTIRLDNGNETIAVSGLIREADISTTDNTISSNKIANAKIYYLGDGDIYDRSQAGWLTDAMSSKYAPF